MIMVWRVYHYQKCTPKTGAIINGVFTLLTSISTFIGLIFAIVNMLKNSNIATINDTTVSVATILALIVIYVGVKIVSAIALLIGIRKRKAHYMFPCLCLGFTMNACLIIVSIGLIPLLFFTFIYGNPFVFVPVFFLIGFKIHFWLKTYSFYLILLAEKHGVNVNPITGEIIGEPFVKDIAI